MTSKAVNIFKKHLTPGFLICAVLLASACIGKEAALEFFGAILKKEPIALKKEFDLIDESKLAPYKVISKRKIENKEVLESLGTEHYIQWILEDTAAGENSPVRFCDLFITYYGEADRVPHVPEECYFGAGNQRESSESILIDTGEEAGSIEMRKLVFTPQSTEIGLAGSKFSIMYFFKVNDKFANSRPGARKILIGNITGKHSYFSKVEWRFFGSVFGRRIQPRDEDIISASEKLVSTILPVLEEDHWPALDEVESKSNNNNENKQ